MKAILILLILSVSVSSAQITELSRRAVPSYESQVGIVIEEVPIEGSPYFTELYVVGNTFVNGRNVRLLMRYNAFSDQIEMKDKYQKTFNLLKRKDLEAHFGGKTYRIMDYVENGKEKQGYFNPLNEGYVTLFYKPKKIFVQAEKPESGYDEYSPPTYKDVSSHYLKVGSQEAVEITLNKRQVLKYLRDEHFSEVKQFVSDNDLKLKSEEEVLLLLNFYNSIKAADKTQEVNS